LPLRAHRTGPSPRTLERDEMRWGQVGWGEVGMCSSTNACEHRTHKLPQQEVASTTRTCPTPLAQAESSKAAAVHAVPWSDPLSRNLCTPRTIKGSEATSRPHSHNNLTHILPARTLQHATWLRLQLSLCARHATGSVHSLQSLRATTPSHLSVHGHNACQGATAHQRTSKHTPPSHPCRDAVGGNDRGRGGRVSSNLLDSKGVQDGAGGRQELACNHT
jgi:hypothetical protein